MNRIFVAVRAAESDETTPGYQSQDELLGFQTNPGFQTGDATVEYTAYQTVDGAQGYQTTDTAPGYQTADLDAQTDRAADGDDLSPLSG